jgi:hypothetical protein
MKNLILIIFAMSFTTALTWADGPGTTSGGNHCHQFTNGILAQVKESLNNKEFSFLDENAYQRIFEKLAKIRISPRDFDLKSKSREMEVDLKNLLIRQDKGYCSKENGRYSPVNTFALLTHEVLSFIFTKKESEYDLTGKNYQQVLHIGSGRVGDLTVGYSAAEYLVTKTVKEMVKNKNSVLYTALKEIYEKGNNNPISPLYPSPPEITLDEAVTASAIGILTLNESHNFGEAHKFLTGCRDNNSNPNCKIIQVEEDWSKEIIVTIDLPDWVHEGTGDGALVHDARYKVAFLFEYTLVESSEYIEGKDYSGDILLKRTEGVNYIGPMQEPVRKQK